MVKTVVSSTYKCSQWHALEYDYDVILFGATQEGVLAPTRHFLTERMYVICCAKKLYDFTVLSIAGLPKNVFRQPGMSHQVCLTA